MNPTRPAGKSFNQLHKRLKKGFASVNIKQQQMKTLKRKTEKSKANVLALFMVSTLISFFLLTPFKHANAQCEYIRFEQDFEGDDDDDNFGISVAVSDDGTIMAVSSTDHSSSSSTRGLVRVYKLTSGVWSQLGADIDGQDGAGYSVSMSGDGEVIAIGAPQAYHPIDHGVVKVYRFISGNWTQVGADVIGEAYGDQFGISTSLNTDGSILAVGAFYNGGNGNAHGHTRIFENISGSWTQLGSDIDGESANDHSGISVALSNDGHTVAIGGRFNDGGGTYRGHTRVYEYSSGSWIQEGLDIDGEADGDYSGSSVSISGDGSIVAIGSPQNHAGGMFRGQVRVFQNTNGTWTQLGSSIYGINDYDKAGNSVSLSSDGLMLAVGAPFHAGGGHRRGQVRVFKFNSTNWVQEGSSIFGEDDGDEAGRMSNIALNADGSILIVGADMNAGGGQLRGHVRMFKRTCLPDIQVRACGILINDGDNTPSPVDYTDFGSVPFGNGETHTFRIRNIGTEILNINSITLSGQNASDYIINNAPTSVAINGAATFDVTFVPQAAGVRSATLTVNSDDPDTEEYSFSISGEQTGACLINQVGSTIEGESNYDRSGTSVALNSDGSIVAIGAHLSAGGGVKRGHVKVFRKTCDDWVQLGSNINGEANVDYSGFAIALDAAGTKLAVGAYSNDGNGEDAGHVRVYSFAGGDWVQIGSDIDGEASNDKFGRALALSSDGQTLAVGAHHNDAGGSDRGHVRVFRLNSGNWVQLGSDIDGQSDNESFGFSVSLSSDGSIVAISAPFNSGGGTSRGSVMVYELQSGSWVQLGSNIDGEEDNTVSGNSVDLSTDGKTVAIGCHSNSGGGVNRGHVRVYTFQSGTWNQLGSDIDGEADYDGSGFSLGLSGDGLSLVIGAPYHAGGGTTRGHVRIFKYSAGSWSQVLQDIDGESDQDQFGQALALSEDGQTFIISSMLNDGGGIQRGHVKIFNWKCPACNFMSPLPTEPGTYTASQNGLEESFTCYCDEDFNLLLAMDLDASDAVIPNSGVKLRIEDNYTTSWNNPGGIITNQNGGAIINRKWDVDPSTQPTSPVMVKYFFTDIEFLSIKAALDNLGTVVSAPTDLEFYKLTTSGFDSPHAPGASGIVLSNGPIGTLNTWAYEPILSNHSGEFMVSSFSGGGIGGGAENSSLPVMNVGELSSNKIYPNPFIETLNVQLNVQEGVQTVLSVTDLTGKTLYTFTTDEPRVSLNLANLPSGVYVLNISNISGSGSYKVIRR
jgi:hypothetical protein